MKCFCFLLKITLQYTELTHTASYILSSIFQLELSQRSNQIRVLATLQGWTKADPAQPLLLFHEVTGLPLLCPKMTDNDDIQLQCPFLPLGALRCGLVLYHFRAPTKWQAC